MHAHERRKQGKDDKRDASREVVVVCSVCIFGREETTRMRGRCENERNETNTKYKESKVHITSIKEGREVMCRKNMKKKSKEVKERRRYAWRAQGCY